LFKGLRFRASAIGARNAFFLFLRDFFQERSIGSSAKAAVAVKGPSQKLPNNWGKKGEENSLRNLSCAIIANGVHSLVLAGSFLDFSLPAGVQCK
jgi:hypothetical protein